MIGVGIDDGVIIVKGKWVQTDLRAAVHVAPYSMPDFVLSSSSNYSLKLALPKHHPQKQPKQEPQHVIGRKQSTTKEDRLTSVPIPARKENVINKVVRDFLKEP